jgi:peptide/nickel transport system substrate-binding protein
MNRSRRGWRIGAIAALVVLVIGVIGAGVGGAAHSTSDRASASTLIDGTIDSVTNVDPAGNYDYGTFTLDLTIYQGLYGFPNGPTLRPVLATGCTASASLKTWTCTLRKGVKFSDGSPMTSADVKFSFDRVTNKHILKQAAANTPSPLISNLKSTSTAGPYKVIFHLKSPQSTWPFILSTISGTAIVPKATYSPNTLQPNTSPQIGTGPYKLVKYTTGQQAVLEANPYYWGPKPKSSTLIINYYSKSSTMKLALQKGEIDMAFRDFTPTELASLGRTKGIRVNQGNGVVIRYLTFNVVRPPFNNLAVRKAIAYLMPRQTIATRVYHGTVKPLYSMVPAGLPGHTDAYATRYGDVPSVAKATAVLKAAGVATPVKADVWWTPTHYGEASADEYAEIQRALNSSGLFKVTLKSAEWAQYSGTLGRTYGAFQLGWFPDYPDAEDYTVSFYQTGNFTDNGYSNPQMTALIKKEQGARTTSARLSAIRAMQALGAQQLPTIPYWQGNMVAPARTNVHGINRTLDAAFNMRFWLISKS